MKINSYAIGMDSARTFSSNQTRKLSIAYSKQTFEGSFTELTDTLAKGGNANVDSDSNENSSDKTFGSSATLVDMLSSMGTSANNRVRQIENTSQTREIENVHQKFIVYLWRLLLGKDKSEELAKEFGFNTEEANGQIGPVSYITIQGFEETYYEETENISFSTNANVTTEDGRSLSFNLEFEMSRSFSQYIREESLTIANMTDPLVINFAGDPAELTDTKFLFDLNNDGKEEEISSLASNSGFLVLDKNDDGIINNGSELFGTSSGNGFADLARYDNDHNGWIDENDEIFDKLQIWVKDNSGSDILYSLKDKNVGAIYLGNADTNYTMRSANTGNVNGAIRKTGIFLYEDGSGLGTVNHLDIAN